MLSRMDGWESAEGPPPLEGWEPIPHAAPFTANSGPFYQRLSETTPHRFEIGAYVLPGHANAKGCGHGGFLATFTDQLLGLGISHVLGSVRMTTLSLNIDYLKAAPIGAWISGYARLLQIGGQTAFADCIVESSETPILRASGTFRLFR